MSNRRFVFIAFIAAAVILSSIVPAYGQTASPAQRLRATLRRLRAQTYTPPATGTTATTPPPTGTTYTTPPGTYTPPMYPSGSPMYPSGTTPPSTTGTYTPATPYTPPSGTGTYPPVGTSYPSGTTPTTGTTYTPPSGTISPSGSSPLSPYQQCMNTVKPGTNRNYTTEECQQTTAGTTSGVTTGGTTSSTGTPNTGSTSNITMASDSFYQCIASGSTPMSRERYNYLMYGNMSSAAEPERNTMSRCAGSSGASTGTYTPPPPGVDSFGQCLATPTTDSNKSSISASRWQELKNSDWRNATAQEFNQRTWCEVGSGSGSGSAGGTASTGDPYLRCLETPPSDGGNRSPISRSRKAELDKNNFQNATSGERNQMNYCTNVAGAGTGTATGGTSGQPDPFRQCVIMAGMTALRLERLWSGYMHEQTPQERDIFSRCGSGSGGGGGTQPPSSGIRVTSPNGGEYWRVREVVSISWANETRPVEVMLQSYMPPCDSKTQPCPMMSAMPMFGYVISRGASSPFQWKVGVDMSGQKIPAGTYSIQISGPSGSDWSDGPVKLYDEGGGQPGPIVCTMEAGKLWRVRQIGDALEIEWQKYSNGCDKEELIRQGFQTGEPPGTTPKPEQDKLLACVERKTGISIKDMERMMMTPEMMKRVDRARQECKGELGGKIQVTPPGRPGPYPDDYPNPEMDDQEQARMLERMKRGVSSVERLVKRMDQKIIALEKRDLSLSVDSLEAMRLLREVITTVKAATEPEAVFEFMAEVPELMRTINLRVRPEIELLANAPSMVREMNRSVRSAKRQQRRLGIKTEDIARLTEIYQAAQEQLKAKDYQELGETFKDFQEELWDLRRSYPGLGESIYRFGITPVEFPGFESDQ